MACIPGILFGIIILIGQYLADQGLIFPRLTTRDSKAAFWIPFHAFTFAVVSGLWTSVIEETMGVVGTRKNGVGVKGHSKTTNGVEGKSESQGSSGVWGQNSGRGSGVSGTSPNGTGVWGEGETGVHSRGERYGVYGTCVTGHGVHGYSESGVGVYGEVNTQGSCGVYGKAPDHANAGQFDGDVLVSGCLNEKGGGFKINHPLDPAASYLCHSFVESDMRMNVYAGVENFNDNNEAVVQLPNWFTALNDNFSDQLTCITEHLPVYIAEQINNNNEFKIAGGKAGVSVSWLVTGIRKDNWAVDHPFDVLEKKPAT